MKKMLMLVFVASDLLGACKEDDRCAQVVQVKRDLGGAK